MILNFGMGLIYLMLTNLSAAVGCPGWNDYVVFNGVNLSNGLRYTTAYYNIHYDMSLPMFFLLILNLIILFYGTRLRETLLRSLRRKNSERETSKVLPKPRDGDAPL
jgi:hypothetical protein